MNHKQDLKFTVIIPTKNRADTLYHSLRTCLAQSYENLEILVSDNFSQDNTREVVEGFQDKRIKYINTNKPLSMTDNWEFALSHVTEGYVTIIGDDDGILLDSVSDAYEALKEWNFPSALAWQRVRYHWDNYLVESKRNQIRLSLGKRLYLRNSKQELRKLSSMVEYDTMILPNLYNSFVKYEIIQEVTRKSNRFFCSYNPDIYSGFAVAAVTDNYLFSEKPFGIAGLSSHSNGIKIFQAQSNDKIQEIALTEQAFPYHHKLVLCTSGYFHIADSLLQAIDHNLLPPDYPISIEQMLKYTVASARFSSPNDYNNIISAVRETAKRNNLEELSKKLISQTPNQPVAEKDLPEYLYEAWSDSVYFRVNPVEVQNVYDAALLIKQLVRLNDYELLGARKLKHKFRSLLSHINKHFLPTKVRLQMRQMFLPLLRRTGIIRG